MNNGIIKNALINSVLTLFYIENTKSYFTFYKNGI